VFLSEVFIFFSQFVLFCFYFSVCYVTVMAVLLTIGPSGFNKFGLGFGLYRRSGMV